MSKQSQIGSMTASPDGETATLTFQTAEGEQSFTFSAKDLAKLMFMASMTSRDAVRNQTQDRAQRHVLQIAGWQFAHLGDGKHLALAVRFPGGAEVNLGFDKTEAPAMVREIEALLAPPEGPVH